MDASQGCTPFFCKTYDERSVFIRGWHRPGAFGLLVNARRGIQPRSIHALHHQGTGIRRGVEAWCCGPCARMGTQRHEWQQNGATPALSKRKLYCPALLAQRTQARSSLTCTPLGITFPNRKPSSVAARLKGRAIWGPKVEGAATVAIKEVTATAPHAIQWDGRNGDAGLALLTWESRTASVWGTSNRGGGGGAFLQL